MDKTLTTKSTWTRFIPEHYDVAAKSPAPLPDKVGKPPFPFMRLPVEIRLQVYKVYLYDRYSISPAEIHEMILGPGHRTKSPAPILQVSKAITAEVKDLLQQEKTFSLRICWQDATFDGLVRSCWWARGTRLGYEDIAHLRIEVYPPHKDRPTDMVHFWKHVKNLCDDLRQAFCLQHLSIHFMENEYAAWSLVGKPLDTIGFDYNRKSLPSDISLILDLFKTLTRVKEAQIHLPFSLKQNVGLQGLRQRTEDVMMKIKSLYSRYQRSRIRRLEPSIKNKEVELRQTTGMFSQGKLGRSCPLGYWISESDLNTFETIWPHRDCVLEWEHVPRSEYIGDEILENAPLTFVNPYRSEQYNEALRSKMASV